MACCGPLWSGESRASHIIQRGLDLRQNFHESRPLGDTASVGRRWVASAAPVPQRTGVFDWLRPRMDSCPTDSLIGTPRRLAAKDARTGRRLRTQMPDCTQAVRALREEGSRVILINSNPAPIPPICPTTIPQHRTR